MNPATTEQPVAALAGQAPALRTSDLLGWAFASSDDEEQWNGPCDTREEAIEEARDYYGDDVSIAVARCRKPRPNDEVEDENWTFVVCGPRETIEPNKTDVPQAQNL